jgi:hypothetical protein
MPTVGKVLSEATVMTDQARTDTPGPSLRKGDRIPSITLEACPGGTKTSVRPSRGPRVLVTMHDGQCTECIDYVTAIAAIRQPLESWGADTAVISPGSGGPAPDLANIGMPVLGDPGHVIADGRLTVIIVDEWGEIYFTSEPEGPHGIVAPDEVVEWVRFIAIQCPECESPEGAWRDL